MIQWVCIGFAFAWLALSFVLNPESCVTRASVFIAATFVIEALR